MPVCCRCGVDQPEDAFSLESEPLCEGCYAIELEEEAAGGEIGNDAVDNSLDQDLGDGSNHGEEEKDGMDQHSTILEGNADEDDEKKEDKLHKVIPLSNAARILNSKGTLMEEYDAKEQSPPDMALLEPLVNAVEERGYSDGFGLDSREILFWRLKRVLFEEHTEVITWLTRPLIHALMEGPNSEFMRLKVAPMNLKETVIEGQTLLHWLVQWKLLLIQCGWKGHDDMVDLLIRAGAPADATLSNGCTPIFFAVKYGSVDTVRLLLDAGANPLQKDCRKQTCLRNALPQASPYILKLLLQHIPADETFVTETYDGSKIRINALDVLVTEFVTPNPDVSWVTMGMASADDYALCILLLLKKGIQISPHYPDVTFFLGKYLQGSIKSPKRLYYTRRIADLLFGQWLPLAVQEELSLKEKPSSVVVEKCRLCAHSDNINESDDGEAAQKESSQVTLHCGHSFCEGCILQYSDSRASNPSSSISQQSSSDAPGCPTCKRPLGRDLLEQRTDRVHIAADTSPLEGDDAGSSKDLDKQRRRGLSHLTVEQLQFECKARNLVVAQKELKEHGVESLVHDWQDFTLPQGIPDEKDGSGDYRESPSSRLMAELTLSNTMISEDNYLWVAPSMGSIMIPITVKGIPIFALLSTTSPYTVLSPRFLEAFDYKVNPNLQVTKDKPLKFVRAEDDDQKANADKPINHNEEDAPPPPKPKMISAPAIHLTAVKDFSFTLGKSGIQVHLPSALQVHEPHTQSWPVGVILGLDFFQSAAWTQLSVEVDLEVCLGRTVALLTGGAQSSGLRFDLIEPRRANHVEQDFRYYSKDGKIFWTPLWHVNLTDQDYCLSLGQYLRERLPLPNKNERTAAIAPIAECTWCCREFPVVSPNRRRDLVDWLLSKPMHSGMVACSQCTDENPAFYCDTTCQLRALISHSFRRHGGADLSSYVSKGSRGSKAKWFMVGASIWLLVTGVLFLPTWWSSSSRQDVLLEKSTLQQNNILRQSEYVEDEL